MIWLVLVGAFGALGMYFYKRISDEEEVAPDVVPEVESEVSAIVAMLFAHLAYHQVV